jgi:glycine hydroxymethyltransferase
MTGVGARLARRDWVPRGSEDLVAELAGHTAGAGEAELEAEIERLAVENRAIHERDCVNLNPATNVLNPRAEAILSAGLGSRPSLGYPGDKYEMGLEAIEKIEIIAAELVAEIFGARFVEFRVPSGSIANLYACMATCRPGDRIIAPPPSIGGHVTHHKSGSAGLYGLEVHHAPVDAARFTVDIPGTAALARKLKPRLITIGGSLNLYPHPIRELRAIADEVGAKLLFDAAHLCGMIAGRAWPQPLEEGAHMMSMSTYKSLGGPAAGLIVTNDASLAETLDRIAHPGLTANFDVAKTASLAITLLDWRVLGREYAARMVATAAALAASLQREGLPVFAGRHGPTQSHQFAIEATRFGGGQTLAKRLRRANLLSSGIGLPVPEIDGDLNGLRLGTPEIVRWGMGPEHMPALARLIARAAQGNEAPEEIAPEVSEFRRKFRTLHFVRPSRAG